MRAAAVAVAMALCIAPAAVAKPAVNATLRTNWLHAYAVTPDGGFLVGNPKAKLAIVEYGSLTCPHCRHFAETAMKPLIDRYVRTGRASYEFRPFILNGIDVAATLVARCSGPAHFFPMAAQLYATQPVWVEKVGNLPKGEQEKLQALPQGELMLTVAKVSGFVSVAAANGISAAKAEACLKDENAAEGLVRIRQAAIGRGVEGTPTFFVNGKRVPAYDWATLEPFLKEPGG